MQVKALGEIRVVTVRHDLIRSDTNQDNCNTDTLRFATVQVRISRNKNNLIWSSTHSHGSIRIFHDLAFRPQSPACSLFKMPPRKRSLKKKKMIQIKHKFWRRGFGLIASTSRNERKCKKSSKNSWHVNIQL